MINIDDRILKEVNSNEYWFLSHLAKRIRNSSESCFPSIATISKDTGFGEKKCRALKKSLILKGKIEVAPRYTSGGLRTSDTYIIKDKKISIMMGMDEIQYLKSTIKELNEMVENLQKTNVSYPPQKGKVGTPQNGKGGPPQNGKGKLLTIESNTVQFSFSTNSKKWSVEHIEKGFELFWEKYGKKQSRKIAFTSWKTVCKNGDAEKAYNGIDDYKKHLSIEKWKHPKMVSTWLNQSTWLDEYDFTKTVEFEKDDFKLSEQQELVYKNWIEEGKRDYPALINSKTVFLTREQLYNLMKYANKETTRIEFTVSEFKRKMKKCFKELNDKSWLRESNLFAYDYIMDEVRKQINSN